MTEHSESEKAAMFDNIIDELIDIYEAPKIDKDFRSRAEMFGYKALVALNDNGFVTAEGILGK